MLSSVCNRGINISSQVVQKAIIKNKYLEHTCTSTRDHVRFWSTFFGSLIQCRSRWTRYNGFWNKNSFNMATKNKITGIFSITNDTYENICKCFNITCLTQIGKHWTNSIVFGINSCLTIIFIDTFPNTWLYILQRRSITNKYTRRKRFEFRWISTVTKAWIIGRINQIERRYIFECCRS
jgi:hypothetical protein